MLSVVIPTRDRRDVLLETLRALEAQIPPEGGFEVIVVDNGSGDGTPEAVRDLAAGVRMPLRLIRDPEQGPAHARNAGVAASGGELLLFLGDDTAPADDGLLSGHVRLHRESPDRRYAVQGRATWTPRLEVTSFMEWLERTGAQFRFEQFAPGRIPPVGSFVTAHVSLKRSLFEQSGGFDTRFPWAALEDVELSIRLDRLGLELDYHPELLVLHDHPTTVKESLDRWKRIGRSAALLHQLQPASSTPELESPDGWRWRLVLWTGPLLRLMSRIPLPGRVLEKVWWATYHSQYARGYREGPP
jgi:GT2 family glycosyltransferase